MNTKSASKRRARTMRFIASCMLITILSSYQNDVLAQYPSNWGPGNTNTYANFGPTQFPFGIWDPTFQYGAGHNVPEDYFYISHNPVDNTTYTNPLRCFGVNVVRDEHSFEAYPVDFKELNVKAKPCATQNVLRIFSATRLARYIRCVGFNDGFQPGYDTNVMLNFEKNLYLNPPNPANPPDPNLLIQEDWTPCGPHLGIGEFHNNSYQWYRNTLVNQGGVEANSVFRWYIIDEPARPSRGWSDPDSIHNQSEFVLLNELSKRYFHGRIMTAIPPSSPFDPSINSLIYQDFVQWCPDIPELMLDVYPYTWTLGTSGPGFQQQLSNMTTVFDIARTAAKSANPKKGFWITAQAFSHPNAHRLPSDRELATQTYLALAHGAEGILYYSDRKIENNPSDEALSTEPFLRYEIARLGSELNVLPYQEPSLTPSKTLGAWLKSLEFLKAFPTHKPDGTSNLPQIVQVNSWSWLQITGINKTPSNIGVHTEIGVFRDGNKVYLFVVDRNPSQGSGLNTVTIAINWEERNILWNVAASGTVLKAVLIGGGGLVRIDNLFKQAALDQDVEAEQVPNVFQLKQNYPNPFNPSTIIPYDIAKTAKISIEVYHIDGRLVKVLLNEFKTPGQYEVVWNGLDNSGSKVSTGVYIVKMSAGEFRAERRITLVK